jgi:RHS repeat-associated protein
LLSLTHRYRGYRYDSETGLYYLQSRYYDPEAGRFINADIVIAEAGGEYLGNNLFVYAFNNPVNMVDDGGNWPKWAKTAVAVASVVAVVAVVATVSVATVGVGTTLLAAGSGAVSGLANKYVADVTYNALSGKKGLGILKPTSSWQDYASSAIAGAVSGMASAVAPGANKLAKNAFDALLKPGVQQCLEIASPSNPRQEMDFGKLGRDALVRFGTSYLKTPCDLTPYSALNKLIGNIPCSVTRGVIKYYRELISSK